MTTEEFLAALVEPWPNAWTPAVTSVVLTSAAPVRVTGRVEGGVVFLLAAGQDGASITVGGSALCVDLCPAATATLPCESGLSINQDGAEIVEVFRKLLALIRT